MKKTILLLLITLLSVLIIPLSFGGTYVFQYYINQTSNQTAPAGNGTGNVTDVWVNETGDNMTGALGITAGNGKIVTTAGAGALQIMDTSTQGGNIDFGSNTAAIGISKDGVSGGYDYDGAFIFKQKASNPDSIGEYIFIEESGDWRFALPSSGADYGTYNPRSMIIAGASVNNASNFECSYWGFSQLDCDTGGTGADLGVQDDLQVLGTTHTTNLNVSNQTTLGGNLSIHQNLSFSDGGHWFVGNNDSYIHWNTTVLIIKVT